MIILITLKDSIIHVYHHAVIGNPISVEHTGGIEVALSFVDDDSVVVEVVYNSAMGTFCPPVVADVKAVAGTVAIGASEVVAAVAISVGCEIRCADYQSAKSEIKAASRDGVKVVGIGAAG